MKTRIITLLLISFFATGFSQGLKYVYEGRFTPSIKKEKLNTAKFVNEIMPDFCRYIILPFGERNLLDDQLKARDPLNRNLLYPPEFYDLPQESYSNILYFISMDITTMNNGKTMLSKGVSNLITKEQKSILMAADAGTDIHIKIRFKYKNTGKVSYYDLEQIKEGDYTVTVIPETEAEYPGGFPAITNYINRNVFDKIPNKSDLSRNPPAVVKFTINEDGHISDARISRTSRNTKVDKLLLDAIIKMPNWKPAKDSKGKNIKQEYSIPLGNDGC
jgi:TonB family protein